jgi:cytochrome c peroxidase
VGDPPYSYQISLEAPAPPTNSYDVDGAARGQSLFEGVAGCSDCHQGPALTDAGLRLHSPEEIGMEPLTAERSATGLYRTTPLRALWQHAPYFHDGSAPSLETVVEHYDSHMGLGLERTEQVDLVEYLKSL